MTAGSISYTPVIQNFSQQWKSLVDRKKEDPPEVPKVTKAQPIIKWSEDFVDHCNRKIGSRTIPLAYVVQNNSAVPGAILPLATDLPHSELDGLVEADLIRWASYNHPIFRYDNSQVYFDLEIAL